MDSVYCNWRSDGIVMILPHVKVETVLYTDLHSNIHARQWTGIPGVWGPGFVSISPACSRSKERCANR